MSAMKFDLNKARLHINEQLLEHYRQTGRRMGDDYEIAARIAEDGHTLELYVVTENFTAVTRVSGFFKPEINPSGYVGFLKNFNEVLH
ncbi:MAG: hypothetical protein JWR74_331 [Polaromonas sp.]|nr:hypothetical protein [Polaromonas sp.]